MIHQTLKQIGSKFVYTPDPKPRPFDYWFVMKEENGKMKGDCDDFSLTVLWYLCGRSFWKFVWNVLILHRYRIYFAKTKDGEGHAVGYAENLWFDNWTKEALPKEEFFKLTRHQIKFFYLSPSIVFLMISGLFKR